MRSALRSFALIYPFIFNFSTTIHAHLTKCENAVCMSNRQLWIWIAIKLKMLLEKATAGHCLSRSYWLLISIAFVLGSWFLRLLRDQEYPVGSSSPSIEQRYCLWNVFNHRFTHLVLLFWVYFQFPLLSCVYIYNLGSILLFAFGHLQPFQYNTAQACSSTTATVGIFYTRTNMSNNNNKKSL